tara:strand:+ start:39127 stop:39909 length:783 start_codon:yes stop_codon:yes gene_type:complete
MRFFKFFGHLIVIIFLTAITQVGGIIWVIALFLSAKFKKKKRIIFPIIYLACIFFIVPPLAKFFGREPLPVFNKKLKPRNLIYPLLFRNYVKPSLKTELQNSANTLFKSDISITYLDANFPFLDKFPLLPHLSHNDGRKIDICFMYLNENKKSTDKKPSISGYGVYANSEKNFTSNNCIKEGYWQYDFSKHLSFGKINNLTIDELKTKKLIKQLLSNSNTKKIFIEPHLKQSLGLGNETKIRFHGCQAVRHDDHIHLETK